LTEGVAPALTLARYAGWFRKLRCYTIIINVGRRIARSLLQMLVETRRLIVNEKTQQKKATPREVCSAGCREPGQY